MSDPTPTPRTGDHVAKPPRELRVREHHYGDFQAAIRDAEAHGYRANEISIIGGQWHAIMVLMEPAS
jgi:hypothetical protein